MDHSSEPFKKGEIAFDLIKLFNNQEVGLIFSTKVRLHAIHPTMELLQQGFLFLLVLSPS